MDRIPENSPSPTNVEVIHCPQYDAVINLRYPDQNRARTLVGSVKEGIQESWIGYDILSASPGISSRYYIDKWPQPEFFAKVGERPIGLKRVREELSIRDRKEEWGKRTYYASYSILNEFVLSGKIKTILDSEEARVIASRFSFGNIQFVEPLLGLKERTTGRRTVIYDFIDADTEFRVQGELVDRGKLDLLSKALRGLLKKQGVHPTDLNPDQFMYKKDHETGVFTLYLIDIAGYFKDIDNRFS